MKASTPVFQTINPLIAPSTTPVRAQAPRHRDHPVPKARKDGHVMLSSKITADSAKDRPDAQVDIAVDHDDRHAHGDDPDRRRLLEQQQHVVDIHKGLVRQRQELTRDAEEDQLEHDKAPDRAFLRNWSVFQLPLLHLPYAMVDHSLPRLAAISSQTARMMMTQVTTYWT